MSATLAVWDILSNLTVKNIVFAAAALYVTHSICMVFYNLYLHPLRQFPGPRVAAMGQWYIIYWNTFRGGMLIHRLGPLHEKYGPVIRIAPNQLHFSTPSAHLTIYTNNPLFVKSHEVYNVFGNPNSLTPLTSFAAARHRRTAMGAHWSRRNILSLQPYMLTIVNRLTNALLSIPGKPQNLHYAYRSLAVDVSSKFILGEEVGALGVEEFRHPIVTDTAKMVERIWWIAYFPILNLASWCMQVAVPRVLMWAGWELGMAKESKGWLEVLVHADTAVKRSLSGAKMCPTNVLEGMLLHEPSLTRFDLVSEAVNLILAASETAGNTLTLGTARLLQTPGVQDRLYAELCAAWPDKNAPPPSFETLEKLPYLSGCVREALRLSYGTLHPLPRIATKPVTISGFAIPAGTMVGMSAKFLHDNPELFPNPSLFDPERWDGEKGVGLRKWLVPYGRGARVCIGMHLGNVELWMAFAAVFRRFKLSLDGFRESDTEMRDFFGIHYTGRQIHALVEEREN